MTDFSSHQVLSELGSKPSIFEVLAEESLSLGLRDAFRHLHKILSENFPHLFASSFNRFEELFSLIDFIFHIAHFRIYGASFAEHFYGLQRIPDPRSYLISNCRVVGMAFMLTVVPYIRNRLETIYKKILEDEANGSLRTYSDGLLFLAAVHKLLYPWLHCSWEICLVYYYMKYALQKADYHSPILHLISTKLIHASDQFMSDSWDGNILSNSNMFLRTIWKVIKFSIGCSTISISCGAFLLQFLEWWYGTEGGSSAVYRLPVPPPPSKWPMESASHICPLCHKPRTNDTALSCSGFVFCYPCIFQHLKTSNYCPVTRYPANVNCLIKIYQDRL